MNSDLLKKYTLNIILMRFVIINSAVNAMGIYSYSWHKRTVKKVLIMHVRHFLESINEQMKTSYIYKYINQPISVRGLFNGWDFNYLSTNIIRKWKGQLERNEVNRKRGWVKYHDWINDNLSSKRFGKDRSIYPKTI